MKENVIKKESKENLKYQIESCRLSQNEEAK
jgi:hypothetical protein